MERKNVLIGTAFILFGVSLYLKKFNVSASDVFVLFLGSFLLYLYRTKRQQPFLIFGGIFTVIGALSLLDDLRLFRNDFYFEVFLILSGLVFLYIYYSRGSRGFVYPGFILPALGTYMILEHVFGKSRVEPAFFILLGIAFYLIYFAAYWGHSSRPLAAGTLMILIGLLLLASRLNLLAIDLHVFSDYLLPALLVLAGSGVLYKSLGNRRKT